jgi:two-component system response regulator FixJ
MKIIHLVDDDAGIRDALTLMFRSRGFRVHAYRSAAEFLEASGRTPCGCVVADMRMPDASGVDLLAQMRARDIALPVVIITASAGASLAVEALRAGASDILEKPFDDEALLTSVRRALGGAQGLAADESRAIVARFASLADHERAVLGELAKGRPNKEIAQTLGLAERAVELHRANIMAKANVGTLVELIRLSLAAVAAETRTAEAATSRPRRRRSNPRGAAAA